MLKKLIAARNVILLMVGLQLAWLAGIWFTRASENWQRLLAVSGISLLGLALAVFLKESFFEKIGARLNELANNPKKFLITLAIVWLLFGIIYASQQRVWPFDEVENFYASQLISNGGLKEFFRQYPLENYLSNRHPPLIFMINGLALTIFGNHLIVIRIVTLIFGYCMLVASYFLASRLFGGKTAVLTVIGLLSYPLIFRESTAGLLDVQATLFFTLTLFFALKLVEKPSWKIGLTLGASLGLGLVSKYMVLFAIPLLVLYFLLQRNYRATVVPIIIAFSLAGAIFLVWTWYGSQIGVRVPDVAGFSPSDLFDVKEVPSVAQEQDGDVIDEIVISPGSFITTEWGRSFLLNSLVTKLPSGLGAYSLPLILLGAFLALRQRSASDLFLFLWIGVVSALLILTLPDHRYFMVIFPALAMLGARWMEMQSGANVGRLTLVLLFCQLAALYLFVDWERAAELFVGS